MEKRGIEGLGRVERDGKELGEREGWKRARESRWRERDGKELGRVDGERGMEKSSGE